VTHRRHRLTAAFLLLAGLAGSAGCKSTKVHCDQLVTLACEQVEPQRDGLEQCERIEKEATAVTDEDCLKTLRLLKETGKLRQSDR